MYDPVATPSQKGALPIRDGFFEEVEDQAKINVLMLRTRIRYFF